MSLPESRTSKAEGSVKGDIPAFQLSGQHNERNSTTLDGPVRPLDGIGAPELVAERRPIADLHVSRVSSEPEIKLVVAPPPTRQISLKLSTDDSTRVNVDVTERAGKVQVAVRTTDHELAQSLQTDLGELVVRLENKGFKTEAWIPASPHAAAAPPEPANSTTGFSQSQYYGSGQGGEQQRQRQNSSNQQRQQARWNSQLEQTMSANETRSESL